MDVIKGMAAVIGILLALTLSLTACGGLVGTPEQSSNGAGLPQSGVGREYPTAGEFGNNYKYSDGLIVKVLSAEQFVPSALSYGTQPGQAAVKVTIQTINGTTQNFDSALFIVHLKYGAAGLVAERVFDSSTGIGTGMEGMVTVGTAATAVYAFAVDPSGLNPLSVEITPALKYATVVFKGAA